MYLSIFALATAAHLMSDFLFQTTKVAEQKKCLKNKNGWLAMGSHIVITFLINMAAFFMLLSGWGVMLSVISVTVIHFILDSLKTLLNGKKYSTLIFVLDQALHIVSIAVIIYFLIGYLGQPSVGYYEIIKNTLSLPDWNITNDNVVWTIVVGIGCIWGGSYLIRYILDDLKLNLNCDEEDSAHPGKWIGILERITILILIPLNQWAAVGLLLTAKSIARHSKMDDERYAEYYLIGTLLSFIIAIVCGVLIAGIWNT